MRYKTILAHFRDESGARALLPPAVELARRFEAHLIGLSVVPPYVFQPSYLPGARTTIVDEHRKAFAEAAKRMKAGFDAATRDAGISAEWIDEDAGLFPVWRKGVQYANAVDIAMAAGADAGTSLLAEGDEQIVLQIGRPMIFMPRAGEHVGFGKRILVAWNGRRESARAAFDTLPLLVGAELVRVLWIKPDETEEPGEELPAADLCTTLARHHVKCEAAEAAAPDAKVGEMLLAQAREARCDLLVMGCYGHSRLREMVLGGATRHILRHMTIPVLMAH